MTVPGIVVGVDGSESSRLALAWALRQAALTKTPVTAVHAWGLSQGVAPPATQPARPGDAAGAAAQSLADAELRRAREQVPGADAVETSAVAVEGSPVVVLLNAAADADHLVVGSRGAGGFHRLLLGSVSSQLIHHATCPVTVVPEPGRP